MIKELFERLEYLNCSWEIQMNLFFSFQTFLRLIERGFIRQYFGRYAPVDEPLSGEHTMIMSINSNELKQYVESKPLPAEIKRYAKSITIS